MAELNLVVLRVADIERAARFYGALGLAFARHRHGKGAEHYACEMDGASGGGMVFELYPRQEGGDGSAGTRLGFRVDSVDAAVQTLEAEGGQVVSPPKDSPWGRRAVVRDLDGHAIELTAAAEVAPAGDGVSASA